MPAASPDYYRERYACDPTYRAKAVASTKRYEARLREEEPGRYAEIVEKRRATQQKRMEDPEFREKFLAAERIRCQQRRAKKKELELAAVAAVHL
jgi:hypothetical protein